MKAIHNTTQGLPLAAKAGLLAAIVGFSGLAASSALACTACNLSFEDEMRTERSDTLAGRDVTAAMANQKNLPLQGFTAMPFGSSRSGGVTAPSPSPELDPMFEGAEFLEIVRRDEGLQTRSTSWVSQSATPDKTFEIELGEGLAYLGNGVMYNGFLTDGKIPGPTLVVDEGDIVKMTFRNTGIVPHGASIHAAYTQTSAHLGNIAPGQEKSITFRVNTPGVYMYHCAPGGHAIPMHVLFGQYGMMVVRPTSTKFKLEEELGRGPDVEINLVQHEWYSSGKNAVEGNPTYVTFNGKLFRYIEEPIAARPGDYVRINFLNIGPNLLSTFHIVGIIWDYAYWQGHPEAVFPGGQSVTAGPTDSWTIEFRIPPEEGAYTMLSHVVGSTSRGAIGLIVADRDAERQEVILADGPEHTQEELAEMAEKAVRVISPFDIGTPDIDVPVVYKNDTKEVTVQIIGNSYYPKVVQVTPGTTVTWINEDVFAYLAGEFSGVHNAVMTSGPDRFASPLLAHAETYSFTFEKEGEYEYICTPHPYMRGIVRVVADEPEAKTASAEPATSAGTGWALLLAGAAILIAAVSLFRKR